MPRSFTARADITRVVDQYVDGLVSVAAGQRFDLLSIGHVERLDENATRPTALQSLQLGGLFRLARTGYDIPARSCILAHKFQTETATRAGNKGSWHVRSFVGMPRSFQRLPTMRRCSTSYWPA